MGHGGRFAKILNHPVFVHVNKLSYAIYLLNPAIITVIYGSKDHSTHVDPITMVKYHTHIVLLFKDILTINLSVYKLYEIILQIVMSVGIMVIVYIAAIIFSIMFEIPYTNLSTKLLKQSNSQIKSTQKLIKTAEKVH